MDISNLSKLQYPDEGFPKRVFKTSAIVSGLFLFYSFYFYSLPITVSLVVGIVISFVTMQILWKILRTVFVPQNVNGEVKSSKVKVKRIFVFVGTAKYIAVGIFLFFVFKYIKVNVFALLVGVSVIQIVIIFKIIGLCFINFLNKSDQE